MRKKIHKYGFKILILLQLILMLLKIIGTTTLSWWLVMLPTIVISVAVIGVLAYIGYLLIKDFKIRY